MPRVRKRHSPTFKAQVALAAIKQRQTTQQIAASYQIHPVQVSQWKKQLLEHSEEAFATTSGTKTSARRDPKVEQELYAEIGRLQMELAWLKKKAERIGV